MHFTALEEQKMQRMNYCVLVALMMLVLSASRALAVNLLANPGFEAPVTSDGPPFIGFWEAFHGDPVSSSNNSTITPRSGQQDLELLINNTANTFAGAFQDVVIVPGTPVTWSGWHRTPSNPLDVGIEFRIEWRNSVSNSEVGRTPNSTTIPTSAYTQFSLTATAPANADIARVVYAIQSFGAFPTHTGTVYVDDVSADAIPEPATATLIGVLGLGLAAARRRR
jgi:MYXO-CTERM domain-containing protein